MRNAIIGAGAIVVLVLAGLFLLSADDNIEAATIKVDGMSCDNCASKIEKTLTSMDGVKAATVSLDDKMVRVNYIPALTDVPALEQAIAKLGYTAGNTNAEPVSNDKATHSDICEDEGGADCCAQKSIQPST
jgi:copper chaperone CopZ